MEYTFKRLTLLCGHYGSGKTNVAVNLAMRLRQQYEKVALADLDIVNPYFRAEDSRTELAAAGIDLICSAYANSNVDLPALPQELYRLTCSILRDDERRKSMAASMASPFSRAKPNLESI